MEKEESKKEKWSSEETAKHADLFKFCDECSKKDSCKEYNDGHKERPCYHSLMIKVNKCKEDYEKEKEFNIKLIKVATLHNKVRADSKNILMIKWNELLDKAAKSKLDGNEPNSDDMAYAGVLEEAIKALDIVIRWQEEEIADAMNKIYYH